MRTLVIAGLSLFTLASCGHRHHGHKEMHEKYKSLSFEEAKTMKLEMLDKKSFMISAARKCVESAQNKDDLETCGKKMHEHKKEMKQQMHDQMKKKK